MAHIMYAAAGISLLLFGVIELELVVVAGKKQNTPVGYFCFGLFMQFLGVNMLIRICITRCRSKNVFEMLIEWQTLGAFIHIYGN